MSEAKKGQPSSKKGIHLSEEIKQKMSASKKGIPTWNKGIPRSEETKQKISVALQGHPLSEETKQKIRKAPKRRIKVSIENSIFDSLTEASKYYNVDISTIRYWAKNKKHNAFYTK